MFENVKLLLGRKCLDPAPRNPMLVGILPILGFSKDKFSLDVVLLIYYALIKNFVFLIVVP